MRILFLCVENAGRSQMAEAFARAVAPPGVEIFSAGSRPAERVNPVVTEVMREARMEIGTTRPKGLGDLPEGVFDLVVTMGCGDACPSHRARKTLEWEIPDPKGQLKEAVRAIRDEIREKVEALLSGLRVC